MARYATLGAWIELKTSRNLERAEVLSEQGIAYVNQVPHAASTLIHSKTQLANIYTQRGKLQAADSLLNEIDLSLGPEPTKARALYLIRHAEYYQR